MGSDYCVGHLVNLRLLIDQVAIAESVCGIQEFKVI